MAGKKILVADDSLTIQKVIRLALSGDGYEIQTVSDGKEAMEQASLFRPDIFIIDVSLPHHDAYQIRELLLQKPDLKNIPVILMSSAFEKVDESRAQKLGFAGHLIKPFDPSHLRSTLLSVATQTPENDPVEATINEPVLESMRLEPPTPSLFQDLPPLTSDLSGPSPSLGGLDDIQEMARNTFSLSGMDQHEWGMIEPGKADHPFQDDIRYDSPPNRYDSAPSPASEVTQFDTTEIDQMPGYQGNSPHQVTVTTQELEQMVQLEVSRILDQMHLQLQDRLEREFREFAQDLMPNLAERILKEEIHKLLSNPPI